MDSFGGSHVWTDTSHWGQKVCGGGGEWERVRVEFYGGGFGIGGKCYEDGIDLEKYHVLPYLK